MSAFRHSFHFRRGTSHTSSAVEGNAVEGNGIVKERILTVPQAPRLHVQHTFSATLRVEPELHDDVTLRVRADENVLPFVRARRRGHAVHLELEQGVVVRPTQLSIEATVGYLHELATAGAAYVRIRGLQARHVKLISAGSSRIHAGGRARDWTILAGGSSRVELETAPAERVLVDVDQSSEARLQGQSRALELRVHGTGRAHADAPQFEAQRARVELTGAAAAWLRARASVTGQVALACRLHVSCDGHVAIDRARRSSVHRAS